MFLIKELKNEFQFPNIFCANARSLSNKMNEIAIELDRNKIDIVVVTETWLSQNILCQLLNIDGYDLRKNPDGRKDGGICACIKQEIPDTKLDNYRSPHPPQANNKDMSDHLNMGFDTLNIVHPNTGLMLLRDFNTFTDWYLTRVQLLSQLVKKPTRDWSILSNCFTNCSGYYNKAKIIAHLWQ